jgi:ribosomal protein S18 acetylase RimI-like enzyme
MKISLLGPEYASEMARLHGLGFARSWPETDFASHVQNTIDLVVGAFDEEKLMGFAVVRRQERQAEMLTIVVSPDSRGKGMGSKILKEAENRASSAGADIMF